MRVGINCSWIDFGPPLQGVGSPWEGGCMERRPAAARGERAVYNRGLIQAASGAVEPPAAAG
jgi:hypothetical protein